MKHLLGGVKKGAFDEAEAQKRFDAWKADKEKGLEAIRTNEAKAKKDAYNKEIEAEKKINETIAKKVADKKAAIAAAKAEAEAQQAAEAAAAAAEAESEAATAENEAAPAVEAEAPAEAEAAPAAETEAPTEA